MNTYDIQTLDPTTVPTNPLELLGISASDIALFLLASSAISLLFFALVLLNIIRNWKVQKAILQLSKDVREMNERQKVAASPPRSTSSQSQTPELRTKSLTDQ